MITKIDITKFGLFSNYKWDLNIGRTSDNVFKKVNIIYGRNYSGKTTLSRIFRCVEKQELHDKYSDGEFIVTNGDGSTSSNANLASPYNIRVYNTDFVRDNLRFLYDENGDIEPFTLLGSGNNALQKRIDEITAELGSVDMDSGVGTGLLSEQYQYKKAINIALGELKKKEATLSEKLTNKANREVKTNAYFVRQATNYNITNIQREIEEILLDSTYAFMLSDLEAEKHKAIISVPTPYKLDKNDVFS